MDEKKKFYNRDINEISYIELLTNESGDWEVLKVDGEIYYEGHSIPTHVWMQLFEENGVNVCTKEISDENMEKGDY